MVTKSVLAAALLVLSGAALATPQVVIDTDFGAPGKSFSDIDPAKGNRITGSLPDGWSDNTGWKDKVVAEYKQMAGDGLRFVRVTQTSGDGLQFTHALPGIGKAGGYYRLTITARSVVGGHVGIRFVGPPYTSVWYVDPQMDGQWRDFSQDFRLAPQPQEVGLFFYLEGNGALDLQKLRLVKLSDEDLVAEIKAAHPDAGNGNLVRLSRFPLGLQSGWSIDRDYSDGDQVRVDSDANVPGPSGCPALRVAAPQGVLIYSAPFAVPWSFETHVASLYTRGNFDGTLTVAGGTGETCGQVSVKTRGSGWTRVELPFKPLMLAPSHHLRLEGKGTLWIDSLKVEHAAKATAFAPQHPMEVSLALPPSPASSARVVFDGEPLTMKYAVVGRRPGALLRARLVTIYGDAKLLPAVKLGASRVSAGILTFGAFHRHPLGPYRLEAWVEDPSGKKLSAENEVVFYRLHRPRYWGKDAPDSFYGTHTLSTNRHLTMAKAVGCNWVRLHDAGTVYIGWSFLEPEKGRWQFRDADLQRYRDHHLMILGLLSTSPGWASNLGKPCTGYFDRYLEPVNMDDWANAVRTIVGRYRTTIDSYEIWNEPWGSSFWTWKRNDRKDAGPEVEFVPSDTPSADYARLQKAAYAAAHEVFPRVTIVGFNTFGAEVGTKWTKDVMGFGGLDTCDAISYHDYETAMVGMPGDASEKAYAAAIGPIVDKVGTVPKPVWMSEGAPLTSGISNGFYRCTLPYENRDDNWRAADRLARFVISRRATGEKHAFLYTMHGHSTFGGSMEWSTLVTADGYLHPSAAAHSALAWFLEDTRFVKRVTLADGVYAYLFSGAGRAVAAITTAAMHAAYRLPVTREVAIVDLFGNPVAPGAAIDGRVHYIVSNSGMARLQAGLKVR